jgi:lipopolysaccharide transport system permease protein
MPNSPLRELLRRRQLLWQMTLRDLKARYAGSILGVFWTVVNPVLLLAVFTFVFTVVFKARFANRPEITVSALYILAGLLPWIAFSEGLSRAASAVPENKNLVTRAQFPLPVLPAYPAIAALLGQLAGIAILVILAAVIVHHPALPLAVLPLILALQLLFTLGLALACAAVSVHLRDLVHLLPVILLVWFYATPVFYPQSLVPPRFELLITLNPMAHFIAAYRAVILDAAWPAPTSIAAASLAAIISLVIGSALFRRLSPHFADRL